jgi:hypothetical protein
MKRVRIKMDAPAVAFRQEPSSMDVRGLDAYATWVGRPLAHAVAYLCAALRTRAVVYPDAVAFAGLVPPHALEAAVRAYPAACAQSDPVEPTMYGAVAEVVG